MQVSIESGEGLQRRMTVKLPQEQIDKEVDKRLKQLARSVKMDGFRPGKVPLSIIKRRFLGSVRQEVFGEQIQSSYFAAVRQESLKPAGDPKIEQLETAEGGADAVYGYTAVFEVLPEFQLGELSGVTIKRPRVEVTEDDVAGMVEKLRKQRAAWNEVDRAAMDGDQVKIDFKGSIDGELFDGGSADDVPLVLGSNSMIEGFEQGLIGASAGETRGLELKFPENYHVDRLAGKPASFEVTVNQVSEPQLPEVDEAFAKSFGIDEGGVERLRQDIRGNMERELEQKIRSVVKKAVMDALVEVNDIELPASLVDKEITHMQEQLRQEAGQKPEGGGMELPREPFEEQAKRRVALGLIVSEIVAANEIKLDSDRVRKTVENLAADYEDSDQVINWYYGNRDQLARVESLVMEDQVVDWVMSRATVVDEEKSFDTLVEAAEGPR